MMNFLHFFNRDSREGGPGCPGQGWGYLGFFLALFATAGSSLLADERLQGIACRSVHLQYAGQEGMAFYNEVTVNKSAEGTYFCVCGFSRGYHGIQELA